MMVSQRAARLSADSPLTYGSYLKLDELLFIAVHQVFELWLRHLLFELASARDEMPAGRTYGPQVRLARCRAIERMLLEQFDVLDSMAAPESVRFLEVEFLSGLKDPCYAQRRDWLTVAEHQSLRRRLAEPSLWDGFLAVLRGAGFDVSTREHRFAAYLAIARDREKHGALWDLLEAMIGHDQSWWMWRARHMLAVERQRGAKSGTNGSVGTFHLRSRLDLRFYPELWEMRSQL